MPKVGNKHFPYTKAGVKAANKAKKVVKKPKPIRRFFGNPEGKVGRPRTNKKRGYDK